jgi:alkanesulfonate monooxygenase SsuD/methylene tetrahydromethanopterin reductase-like flavin-dependent oxidoreductase (luciferase family)
MPIYLANAPNPDGRPEDVDRMLGRALRHADGWHPTGLTPAQFEKLRVRLEALAAQTGRDLSEFSIACGSLVNIQPDRGKSRAELEDYVRRYWPNTHTPRYYDRLISGPPEAVADGILAYWRAGAKRISVRLGTADYDTQLPLLLNEVMPAIRQAVAR